MGLKDIDMSTKEGRQLSVLCGVVIGVAYRLTNLVEMQEMTAMRLTDFVKRQKVVMDETMALAKKLNEVVSMYVDEDS